MATKRETMIGLGFEDPGDDDDYEMMEDEESTEDDAAFDEAVDTFLDDSLDIETRREAFRSAVKYCK